MACSSAVRTGTSSGGVRTAFWVVNSWSKWLISAASFKVGTKGGFRVLANRASQCISCKNRGRGGKNHGKAYIFSKWSVEDPIGWTSGRQVCPSHSHGSRVMLAEQGDRFFKRTDKGTRRRESWVVTVEGGEEAE